MIATSTSGAMQQNARFSWASGLSLDLKLGGRMLAKYPGITLVGGIAMAFAIWFGTVVFEMLGLFLYPTLPLPGGDRIVQVFNWDAEKNTPEKRTTHDFFTWQTDFHSVKDLGAFRDVSRNLAVPGGETKEVLVAEMTPSGFTISSAKPLMGRTLTANDEKGDAPPVAVIGYKVWKERFGSDPAILGKSVKIGDSFVSIVGVMNEGYAFPIAHEVWMPMHLEQMDRSPRGGAPIGVFGRLVDGVSIEKAQTELNLIGARAASQFKETHEHLKPRVLSYVADDDPSGDTLQMTVAINMTVGALMVLICGNIALLLFARAATRETELTVRSALGANRGRIVMQLFAEALVLGGVAAAIGLIAAEITLRVYGMHYLEINYGTMPFWFDTTLSPLTVLYAIGLTFFCAVIVGVLPALKVTRGISAKLRQGTAGSGLRFGGVWTFVIVAQVAATVLLPAIVAFEQNELSHIETFDVGFPSKEYLGVKVQIDAPPDTTAARLEEWRVRSGATLEAFRQRVSSEPGVQGVSFVSDLPSASHGGGRVQLADSADFPPAIRVAHTARVDLNYFNVVGAPMLSGRAFHSGDLAPGTRNAIVDLGFVQNVLGGANPLGRRIRVGKNATEWFEVVGVVKDLGMNSPVEKSLPAGVYMATMPEMLNSRYMLIHMSGDPLAISPKLRTIAESIDPTMRLNEFVRVDKMADPLVWFMSLWQQITMILTGIAVLLSLAGIYAVLSVTVSKRTREIGVRVAVGASPRRIVTTIFKRPLTQVSIGIGVGAFLVGLGSVVVRNHKPDSDIGMHTLAGGMSLSQFATLVTYTLLMLGVCLLACVVPTRRALGVQPTEALRAE